jgi:hypothetical protein
LIAPPTLGNGSRAIIAADPLLTDKPAINADYGDFPSEVC